MDIHGIAETHVLWAKEPGKRGRGNRVCSRKGEHDILSLKRELEELNMTSIEDMKANVKRARPRPVARPLLQERGCLAAC